MNTLLSETYLRYLASRDQNVAARIRRTIGAMTETERQLTREAAVMGYVLGAQAQRCEGIPPDGDIHATVLARCFELPHLYPAMCSIADARGPDE